MLDRFSPRGRVTLGRRVALAGIGTYALTRAMVLAPGATDGDLHPVVEAISMDGHILWAWSLAWLVAAVLCFVDFFSGETRRGIPLAVGLGLAWGVGAALIWIIAGVTTGVWENWWVTSLNYLALSLGVGGLMYKTAGLRGMIAQMKLMEGEPHDPR